MRRFRHHVSVMGICLTALMTLVAGTPHFYCVCPDGRVKPFCLSFFARTSCCVDSCCMPAQTESESGTPKKTCCCCPHVGQSAGAGDQQLSSGGCTRTLVDASACTITASTPEVIPDSEIGAWVAALDFFLILPTVSGWTEQIGLISHRPPPPDLITLLHHFLI